ncbi:MAG TPA: GNAT family N-acetyltransferase [Ktedonobacterales bacterium]|nr:GNAT family N-acetyltransferase [Ktedonobacterales bacterium]
MVLEEVTRLALAVEANWCAAWASLAGVRADPPTLVDDTPDSLRVYTPGVGEMLVNIIIRYRGPQPVAAADVERTLAPYRAHRLPFQWWLTYGSEPPGLREHLRRAGLISYGGIPSMALDLTRWQPPAAEASGALAGVTLAHATTLEDAAAAHEVICRVFDVAPEPMARWTVANPRFALYVARREGEPASALATFRDGETVGVYHVATRYRHRRQGLAAHLLAVALLAARAQGATLATLTATPEARHVYETLGFRAYGAIEQWVSPPEPLPGYGAGPSPWRGPNGPYER